jgi:hypothetical protein
VIGPDEGAEEYAMMARSPKAESKSAMAKGKPRLAAVEPRPEEPEAWRFSWHADPDGVERFHCSVCRVHPMHRERQCMAACFVFRAHRPARARAR